MTRLRSLVSLGALLLAVSGCIHQTPTEVHYDPVDVRSRTDLVGLATRHFGFERGTPPPFGVPVHLAFAWVRDTRAFPHHYGTDQGRLAGPERQELVETLQARLSSPPFAPVTRIPAPAVTGHSSPMAVPAMPVSSATRLAVQTARRLGAEVVIVVQTRTEEALRRNLLWPLEHVDLSGKLVPGRDLTVHARAEACAIWVAKGWLLQCREGTGEAMLPWVGPLQHGVIFSGLRQQALHDALAAVAAEIVDALLPLSDPPGLRPDEPEPRTSMPEALEPAGTAPAAVSAAPTAPGALGRSLPKPDPRSF